MRYHEAIAWTAELYTHAYVNGSLGARLRESNGDNIFGLTLAPRLNVFDIAFFENLWMYWSKSGDHCMWPGWWMEIMYLFWDLSIDNRECGVGVYNYLQQNGEFRCYNSAYTISEAYWQPLTGLARYTEGRYDYGWSTCQDYEAFNMHTTEVRSIRSAFDDLQDDAQDEEFRGE